MNPRAASLKWEEKIEKYGGSFREAQSDRIVAFVMAAVKMTGQTIKVLSVFVFFALNQKE